MGRLENPHSCVSCGYDGGIAASKEVAELRERLAYAKNSNPASGAAKLTFAGFFFAIVAASGLVGWESYISGPDIVTPPPPPAQITQVTKIEHPITAVYENIYKMYKECVDSSSSDLARERCNKTYETSQAEVIDYMKKAYPNDSIPKSESSQ